MRISHNQLKKYLPDLPSPDVISETLTNMGLEVESIINFDYLRDFYVVRIEQVQQHPNADRLSLCQVRIHDGSLVSIVCGAENVRPGLITAYAPVGVTMPSGLKIRQSKIRGEVSNGMMCARDELGLVSRASRGIMELDPSCVVGTNLVDALGLHSTIYDISVTPNRGDCLNSIGIARELSTKLSIPLTLPEHTPIPADFASPISISCAPEARDACPHFLARVIRGVKNQPSPQWLQTFLREAGCSTISALVDITNYICLNYGRPMHVFDQRNVKKNSMHLRLAKPREPFLALDDTTYPLPANALVIEDGEGNVISLAGIMGGKESGSYEDTTDIVLECAYFRPEGICRTGQATHIISDSRFRFERGVDPTTTHESIERATALVLEICGGSAGSIVEYGAPINNQHPIPFCPEAYTNHIGHAPPENTADLLNRLGYHQTSPGTWMTPSWRYDTTHPNDLFADIWRMTYDGGISDAFDCALPTSSWAPQTWQTKMLHTIHETAQKLGYNETNPFIMINAQTFKTFAERESEPHIQNPISQELTHIRPNLIATLLHGVKQNVHQKLSSIQLYEVGPVYDRITPESRRMYVGGIRCGPFNNTHWQQTSQSSDFFMSKADVFAILDALNIDVSAIHMNTSDIPAYSDKDNSAHVVYNNQPIGFIGTVHRDVVNNTMKTTEPITFFEISIEALHTITQALPKRTITPPSSHHHVERDFAFLISRDISAQQVIEAVYKKGAPWISHVHVFDYFPSKTPGDTTVSLGLRCILQPDDRPLDEATLSQLHKAIILHIEKTFNARIRQ